VRQGVTNVGASVRQRLLNEAKRRAESFDYVASLYARERFLARLSVSPHRSRLVLKGASVMALWVHAHRTTRDLDFLGTGSFAPGDAVSLIREIVSESVIEDGLVFDPASVTAEAIRDADEYRGARVHVDARLDSARIRLQIDIGVGDVVTPSARTAILPTILAEFPAAKVKVYPPETIVAEKLHALVKLGIANSRMKDFYDLYILARSREFDDELLAHAVRRTFARRKTPVVPTPFALSPDFYRDAHKRAQWRAFLGKSRIDGPADFSEVGETLRAFLAPILVAINAAR
jgi:predicted nucleotidyltransferase component of viral defense system